MTFAEFIEKIGEANFDEDVVGVDVFFELFFVFEDGVFESDAIGAHDIGINNEIIFGIEIANGGGGIPDFFGIGWLDHAGDNSK